MVVFYTTPILLLVVASAFGSQKKWCISVFKFERPPISVLNGDVGTSGAA
jgi:hypothetical protein